MRQGDTHKPQQGRVRITCVRFFLACFLLLSSVSPLIAQNLNAAGYKFQPRPNARGVVDRDEGLHPIRIAGEHLDLVAAFLLAANLPEHGTVNHYRLGFVLPRAEPRVVITVRHDDTFRQAHLRYEMLPKQTRFSQGFQEFAWDARLVQDLGIPDTALNTVAKIGGQGREVIAPVLLSPAPFPQRFQVQGCRFVFVPSDNMQVSSELWLLGKTPRLMAENAPQLWTASHDQEVTWNGKDLQGQPASVGWYKLALTARLMPAGQPEARLSSILEFYYTPMVTK